MEREFSLALVQEWTNVTSFDWILLNDYIRADILLSTDPSNTKWLRVQLKTSNVCKDNPNAWAFNHVAGYDGMPVVCWATDIETGWIHDGSDLNFYSGAMKITHHGMESGPSKNERCSVGRKAFDINGLATKLHSLSMEGRWEFVSEEYSRWEFKPKATNQFIEMVTIEIYRSKHPGCQFPTALGSTVDLVGPSPTNRRLQFKHACVLQRQTGFYANLRANAGRLDCKTTNKPYESSDFDELVVMRIDWHMKVVHVWEIPMSKLIEERLVNHNGVRGKTTLYVHATPDITGQITSNNKSSWTIACYKGALNIPVFSTDAIKSSRSHFERIDEYVNVEDH